MPEALINTSFNGSDNSLLMFEQAMALNQEGSIAVQMKNIFNGRLNYLKDNEEAQSVCEYEVVENATHIYGLDLTLDNLDINASTKNILFVSDFNKRIQTAVKWRDFLPKFSEVWVADQTLQDYFSHLQIIKAQIVSPSMVFYPPSGLNIAKSDFNILCHFPYWGVESVDVFLQAYLQCEMFENAELIVISDLFVLPNNNTNDFVSRIRNMKEKYNIPKDKFKINLLTNKTPINVNHCIINSDMCVLPDADNSGWNLFAAHAALKAKPVVLTRKSCMAKYINNSSIIMDLPTLNDQQQFNNRQQAINIWKLFLNNSNLKRETKFINNNANFIDECRRI